LLEVVAVVARTVSWGRAVAVLAVIAVQFLLKVAAAVQALKAYCLRLLQLLTASRWAAVERLFLTVLPQLLRQ
jgi:predicted LPLAT superfamily acyltransferase